MDRHPTNILDIKGRAQFRQWLIENHATQRECWVVAKRGKTPPEDALWYLDAVEEALCFGWIVYSDYATSLSTCEDRQYPQGKIKAGVIQ